MLNQRLQILLTEEQHARLKREAGERGASVGALVREAIEARHGPSSAQSRRQAFEEIAANRSGRFLSPSDINRAVAAERDGAAER